jgi:excisionase family DNA binding protein
LKREISQLHGNLTIEHVGRSMPILLRRLKSSRNSATATAVSPLLCGPAVSGPAGPNAAAAGTEPSGPPFRSLREAAGWLCVSLPTLKPTIAKRDLRTVRVGKHRKVPASYLAAYVAKDILLLNQVVDFTQDCSIAFEYSDSE